MNLKNFVEECHDKEVFKKLSIYIVSCWVFLQVLAVTWEPLGLPQKTVTFFIILALIGFPVNGFLVWKYHLIHLDYKAMTLNEEGNLVNSTLKNSPFQKMYFSVLIIVSIISLSIVALIINNNFNDTIESQDIETSDKIAVLKFGNNTGDKKYDIVGKMTADWIVHRITENNVGQVVSPEILDDYVGLINTSANLTPLDNDRIIKEYFSAGKLISGNFYLKNNKLLFQGSITDGAKNIQLISFKLVECDSEMPLECIEKLTQLILGYLISEDNKISNLQEDSPPKFEAYKYLIDAKENIANNELYIELINKSIEIDENYFEPKVLKVAYYYNIGDFKKSDSLLKQISPTSYTNQRQLNLLNLYESLLKGDNKKVYNFSQKEYEITPFDLLSNSSQMTIALQFVNKPADVNTIFEVISTKGMDVENCAYCEYRIYVKALSEIELGNYQTAIDLLVDINEKINKTRLKRTLLTAYIRSKNDTKVDEFISKAEISSSISDIQNLYLHIGKEYLLLNLKGKADLYFNKLISSCKENDEDGNLALAYFYTQNYSKAEKLFQQKLNKDPNDINALSKLASCEYKLGNIEQSKASIEKLKQLEIPYQFGKIDYAFAQYYAIAENNDLVMKHLLKAVSQGTLYTPTSYLNDPIFVSYFENPKFKEILTFWH
ncbi:hypothetical protein [Lutibacter sp.]|uniref:tetratricopeptide repeat protein n=1 Tax=Lutibacter sp. TaxID=1925666 RepID=UPI001A361CD5|nr:hypothetical protein [Lutibacter sp.]MBI9042390.1 hypothetical protein [Lutibacter sp.]